MKRFSYSPLVSLVICLTAVMMLPASLTMTLRSFAIHTLSPSWRAVSFIKRGSMSFFSPFLTQNKTIDNGAERKIVELQRENQVLHAQLEHLRQWLISEDRLEQQIQKIKECDSLAFTEEDKGFYRRRAQELSKILGLQSHSLPARVIFREPSLWSSYLWINVGEKNNKILGKKIIAKNSPVLFGGCLIGVVEDVRNGQSRVRLITDSGLTPSVRTVRGKMQSEQLALQLGSFIHILKLREDLFLSQQEQSAFLAFFDRLHLRLSQDNQTSYLAKGVLKGCGMPLWRSRNTSLKGLGFNYDCSDIEGDAKQLIALHSSYAHLYQKNHTLLKEGDLLITSGMDGVFPAGLPVAFVTKVESIEEGSTAYDLVAEAAAGSLDHLTGVVVLPPQDFEKDLTK